MIMLNTRIQDQFSLTVAIRRHSPKNSYIIDTCFADDTIDSSLLERKLVAVSEIPVIRYQYSMVSSVVVGIELTNDLTTKVLLSNSAKNKWKSIADTHFDTVFEKYRRYYWYQYQYRDINNPEQKNTADVDDDRPY